MKQFQRILVGVDLTLDGTAVSVGSRRAALQAQWLAERTGASLTFLHSTWNDAYEDGPLMRHGTGPEATKALDELQRDYAEGGVEVELVLTDERPWVELVRRTVDGRNDLVVVGRRNEPGVHAFGSVAKKLMRKCPAPVWVVKPEAALVHAKVMAATDLTPVGDRAIELAAYVARAHECTLHVVHAWQRPFGFSLAEQDEQAAQAELARMQREPEEHVQRVLDRVASDLEVKLHVANDSPSRLIRAGVEELGVDLLVMGSVSRSGVPGLLMGNTAERILERVGCSVLTIKPEDFVSPIR